MILPDTSGLLAALFVDQRHHEAAGRALVDDERHFRVLRGAGGRPSRLLPADG